MEKAVVAQMLKSFLVTMRVPKPVIDAVSTLMQVSWTMPVKTTAIDLQLAEKDLSSCNGYHIFGNLNGKAITIFVLADDSMPVPVELLDLLAGVDKEQPIA